MPQSAAGGERRLDPGVGLEDRLAADELDRVEKPAVGADRCVDVEVVPRPRAEVIGAVSGRRVHRARARFQRDVVGQNAQGRPPVERVLEPDAIEQRALQSRHRRAERALHGGGHAGGQRLGDDHHPPVDVVRGVVEVGMEGDGQVRGNRPRRGGPDEDRHRPSGERRDARAELAGALGRQGELDVDRRRDVGLVLDLGLGERRAAPDAPVHRLLPLVDEPPFHESAERAHDVGLVREPHGEIGVIPVAQDAEPPELVALDVDEPLRVRAARPAELGDGQMTLLGAELLVDLVLDGQAVTIPARDVRRVHAGHAPRPHDEVLQHLVEGMPDVDVAVGIRRAVVQHEQRPSPAPLAQPGIQVHRLPSRDRGRLGRFQVGLHRKAGAREVQRVLPVSHFVCSAGGNCTASEPAGRLAAGVQLV